MVSSNVWVKLKLAKLGLAVWIWLARTHDMCLCIWT